MQNSFRKSDKIVSMPYHGLICYYHINTCISSTVWRQTGVISEHITPVLPNYFFSVPLFECSCQSYATIKFIVIIMCFQNVNAYITLHISLDGMSLIRRGTFIFIWYILFYLKFTLIIDVALAAGKLTSDFPSSSDLRTYTTRENMIKMTAQKSYSDNSTYVLN